MISLISRVLARRKGRALQREGWELFIRLQEPTANARDLDEFEQWRMKSDAHARMAVEIEDLWMGMDSVRDLPWPSTDDLDRDSRLSWKALRPESDASMRPALAGVVAVCVVALVAGYFFLPGDTRSFSTGRGEHRLVNLSDGSELILGAMSEVIVDYSATRRGIRQTKGEVLFTVAEETDRPFIVETDTASVRAVGTAFNINASGSLTVVSVVTGTVRVSAGTGSTGETAAESPDTSRELTANQQILLGSGAILQDIHPINIDDVLAWRSGRFVFSGTPLSRVVEDINRYSDTPVRLENPATGELLFTGVVQRTQIDSWLSALEASFPVQIRREESAVVIQPVVPQP